jgi:hypothetical protein
MIITKDSLFNPAKRTEFVQYINRTLDKSVRNYEKANNGLLSENARAEYEKKYQEQTDEVENLLKGIDISVMWPGLFPVYLVNGRQEHNLDRAIKEIIQD